MAESRKLGFDGRAFALLAAFIVVADQITKYLAVAHLTRAFEGATTFAERLSAFQTEKHPRPARAVTVLEDFWHFRYAENTGAAFSFLADADSSFRVPFFILITLLAMIFIVVYFRKSDPEDLWPRVALSLVFGGALGNFIDRVRLGYVIDFISWHWYDKAVWPTFNVADSAISVGVVALVLHSFVSRKPDAPASSKR